MTSLQLYYMCWLPDNATYLKPAIENDIALCTKLATFISDVISKAVKEAGMLAYSLLLDETKDFNKNWTNVNSLTIFWSVWKA